MRRFHKPDDEKRALVVLPPNDVDAWLHCRDPELARSFLRAYPAQAMKAWAAPRAPAAKAAVQTPPGQQNLELF
jgi:putative SOS response-associated peptidase YedK